MHYCENLEVPVNFIQLQAALGHNFSSISIVTCKRDNTKIKRGCLLVLYNAYPHPLPGFQAPIINVFIMLTLSSGHHCCVVASNCNGWWIGRCTSGTPISFTCCMFLYLHYSFLISITGPLFQSKTKSVSKWRQIWKKQKVKNNIGEFISWVIT